MKLRIKDNSIRFRLLRGEVEELANRGRIEAHTLLSPTDEKDRITYAIEHADHNKPINVARLGPEIRVTLPSSDVLEWANGQIVGIYGEQPVFGGQLLTIMIEKDFACTDRPDAENADTFKNPNVLAC